MKTPYRCKTKAVYTINCCSCFYPFTFLLSCRGGKYKAKRNLTFAFYNVENLFDVKNEPGKREDEFKVVAEFPVRVHSKNEPDYKTRDILYVKGVALDKEEFHIFVNHWPSRIGGLAKSEPDRIQQNLRRSQLLRGHQRSFSGIFQITALTAGYHPKLVQTFLVINGK